VIRIAASTHVSAPRSLVFAFLADRNNHWHLAGRSLEPLEIGQDGAGQLSGVVAIRGPLGIRRRALTRVVTVGEPEVLAGVAEVVGGTTADVCWELVDAGERGTLIELSATVTVASRLDRLLLALGGRLWMRRVFAGTLDLLARRLQALPVAVPLQAA
jgi:Polyketide cyclase / dehydrase and lipid transport